MRSDLPAPAIGSDVRHLVIVSAWPESVAGYSEQGRRLAERIQVASAGRFVFSFAHRDNRGGQVSATGDADLVLGSEHRNLGRHPAFAYFAGLPCRTGLRAADFDRWLAAGGGQMMWDGLAAEHGLKPLLIGHSGGRPGWWSAQPISRIADLQGKRVAVEGLARNVAAAIGAEPVEVLIGSMAPAVIEGDVAAAEWGGLLASCAIGLDKARCWTGFGINTNGTALSLGIRRDLWDAFSASDRAIFEGAAAEAFRFSLAEARVHEPILRKVLAETRGVQFGRLPRRIANCCAVWRRSSLPTWPPPMPNPARSTLVIWHSAACFPARVGQALKLFDEMPFFGSLLPKSCVDFAWLELRRWSSRLL